MRDRRDEPLRKPLLIGYPVYCDSRVQGLLGGSGLSPAHMLVTSTEIIKGRVERQSLRDDEDAEVIRCSRSDEQIPPSP